MKIELMRFLDLIESDKIKLLSLRRDLLDSVRFKLFDLGQRELLVIDKQLDNLDLYQSMLRFLIEDKT